MYHQLTSYVHSNISPYIEPPTPSHCSCQQTIDVNRSKSAELSTMYVKETGETSQSSCLNKEAVGILAAREGPNATVA